MYVCIFVIFKTYYSARKYTNKVTLTSVDRQLGFQWTHIPS